jgi:hypothetical protein
MIFRMILQKFTMYSILSRAYDLHRLLEVKLL